MGYRIIQMYYDQCNGNAEVAVEQGIMLRQRAGHTEDLGYGKIKSIYTPSKDFRAVTIYYYMVKELNDGFKDIIFSPIHSKEDLNNIEDEGILLVTYYLHIKNKLKRIAGRYEYEGVYIVEPNEIVSVEVGDRIERFKALKIENKMYLIKLYQEE